MSNKPFATSIATLLIIALIVPATFFIAPQRVSASGAVNCIGSGIGALFGFSGSAASVAGLLTGVPVVPASTNALVGIGKHNSRANSWSNDGGVYLSTSRRASRAR